MQPPPIVLPRAATETEASFSAAKCVCVSCVVDETVLHIMLECKRYNKEEEKDAGVCECDGT